MAYEINYDDERFSQVESDKQESLSELEQTYSNMINNSDSYYNAQINASKEWADKQSQIQQDKTDFAIEQIEQQKEQANKDYIKEQSGAYVDWRKQSNEYGAKAEEMASAGLANTGYSESSQVSMYNTYQNRVATARESYNQAVLNYNNAIKDAHMQNNAALAEIAYNALQQQLELSLQGFQYKNQLILDKADRKTQLENTYYSRYQDVLAQINTENSLAEQIRQYNESLALEKEQMAQAQANWEKEYALAVKSSSGGGGGSGTIHKDSSTINKSSTSNATQQSIIDVGYGPRTEAGMAALVSEGKVTYTTDNKGNIIFQRNDTNTNSPADTKAAQALLDKYTLLK